MFNFSLFIAAACLLCTGLVRAEVNEQIVRLQSSGDAVLPYLLSVDDAQPPRAAAVMFTGGGGALHLLERGIPRPGANFLLRTRALFLAQGIATAFIDVPSGMNFMADGTRVGSGHAADVGAVVADLKRRLPGVRVHLVGTSRGTLSAAYAAAALGHGSGGRRFDLEHARRHRAQRQSGGV